MSAAWYLQFQDAYHGSISHAERASLVGVQERALENVAAYETIRLGKALLIVASATYIGRLGRG